MATLALNNKNRTPCNNCPFELDPVTPIGLTGFVICSARNADTIYRQQNISSPEKNVLTKNIISLENIGLLLFSLFSLKNLLIPFYSLNYLRP